MKTTLLFVSIFILSACGSSSGGSGGTGGTGGSGGSGGAACANPGGAVSGAMDTHCADACAGANPTCDPGSNQMCINQSCVTAVQQSMCAIPDAAPMTADAGPPVCPYGDTNYNAVADDDDCKYHVTWTSTAVCENTDVFFTVVANYRNTSSSAGPTGTVRNAMTIAEVFLSDTHPAPNTNQTVVENPPGTYKVGPIRFDAPGKWTVRFHYYENCQDTPSSPHGHSAFFVNVP